MIIVLYAVFECQLIRLGRSLLVSENHIDGIGYELITQRPKLAGEIKMQLVCDFREEVHLQKVVLS